MRYIIYCRKSTDTDDKQVLSLESQQNELKRIVERDNLQVVDILTESRSAKAPGRPFFDQMLNLIEKGKADAILCWKVDRLTRNPVDGGKLQWLLQNGKIKEIKTFEKTYLPHDNVLLMSIEQAMANQYILNLSVDVKRGNREKLERGEYPNRPPVGYFNDKLNKKIITDEERKKYVVRGFELYSTGGYSFKDISDILFNEGFRTRTGKRMLLGNIEVMLKDTFYYGVMKWNGKLYQGIHAPLISKDLYDKCLEVREKRKHPRTKSIFFPLRGFVTCANCGCAYTSSLKKGHDYYYCTNGKKICDSHKIYLREDFIYESIVPILESLAVDPELVEIMYQSALEQSSTDTTYFDETVQTLQNTLNTLNERESRLIDTFLDQYISKETYDKKSLEISNSIFETKQNIQEIKQKKEIVDSTLEPLKNLFLDCDIWSKTFLELKPQEKHKVVKRVLWNLSIKDKKIVNYELKSPYSVISKAGKITTLEELRAVEESDSRHRFWRPKFYH